LPDIKQLHFFDKHFERGLGWYTKFFADAKNEHLAIGEMTPDYLSNDQACRHIREVCGELKVIVIYRDPVERAFSHYKVGMRSGKYLPEMSFLEAVRKNAVLIRDGLYGLNVGRCIDLFGEQNVHVGSFEEMKLNPSGYITKITAFLSVTGDFEISSDVLERKYAASVPRAKLEMLNRYSIRVRCSFESTKYGRKFTEWLRDAGIVGKLHGFNSTREQQVLTENDYRMCCKFFSEDMADFAELIQRYALGFDAGMTRQWAFAKHL